MEYNGKGKGGGFTEVVSMLKRMVSIESERLLLRRIQKRDAAHMYDYAKRGDVTRYLLWSPHPSPEYTASYISSIQRFYRSGQYFDYAVILKSENRMIGTCGFSRLDAPNGCAEAGYVINPDYQGRGYATEALNALLHFGFRELGLNRIEARFMTENKASLRVMEKCGMSFEGVQRELMLVRGEFRDVGVCSLLAGEFHLKRLCENVASPVICYREGFFGELF